MLIHIHQEWYQESQDGVPNERRKSECPMGAEPHHSPDHPELHVTPGKDHIAQLSLQAVKDYSN